MGGANTVAELLATDVPALVVPRTRPRREQEVRARALEAKWEDALHGLRGAANVIDLRNFGLVAGIELAPRAGAPGARGTELFQACFDAGLLVRATGDTIALSPPLIVEEAQIDSMFGTIAEQMARID